MRIVVLDALVADALRDIGDAAFDRAGATLLGFLDARLLPGDAVVGNGIDLDRVPGLFRMAAAFGRFHLADIGRERVPAVPRGVAGKAVEHFERRRDMAVHVDDPVAVTHQTLLVSRSSPASPMLRRRAQRSKKDFRIEASGSPIQRLYHARAVAARR